jgi:hypothetical protein
MGIEGVWRRAHSTVAPPWGLGNPGEAPQDYGPSRAGPLGSHVSCCPSESAPTPKEFLA